MKKILLLIVSIGALISCNSDEILDTIETAPLMSSPSLKVQEPILIENAGLVLLNPYLPELFKQLGLTSDSQFIDSNKKIEAVYYLQYLVFGSFGPEDSILALNKILCGIPISESVTNGIDLSNEEKIIIEQLLPAVISQWRVISNTSVQGFRDSFLHRKGILVETEDGWELKVEGKAFDMLLDQIPWSISIVRYPWMNKTLHANWR